MPRSIPRIPLAAIARLFLFPALSLLPALAHARDIADWSGGIPDPWQTRVFEGETRYVVIEENGPGDGAFLRAEAESSASALYREIEVDVTRTPYLQWSWRVDELPEIEASERSRAGDDYAARIYIVREGWLGSWTARAINYVWSAKEPVGSRWPNAFTGNATMWSVDQGREQVGEWVRHTRNVREDWRAAYGEDLDRIDGVALMTDADNSESRARAAYGSIRFCERADCGSAD